MAVITTEGLLGKISESDQRFSTVLLIDDRRFAAAVRIRGRKNRAVLAGAGGSGSGGAVLKYLASDLEVRPGDVIVTSGLDALFPRGIKVGYVNRVLTQPEELFHTVEVSLYVDPRRTDEVIILRR